MSTQELVDLAKACHPNVSMHAYDATYRKFMKHKLTTQHHTSIFCERSSMPSDYR